MWVKRMLFQKGFNSKKGNVIAAVGMGLTIIGAVLALAVFGFTFGTACLIGVGVFFVVYGMTFTTTLNINVNLKLLMAQRVLSCILLLGLISFIGIEILIFESQKSDNNVQADYAIILGAGIQGEKPSVTLRRRLDRGVEYLNANPNAKVVTSGGFGEGTTVSEAEVMKRYFIMQGINESRIIKEEPSTTTDENLKFTKQLLTRLTGREVQDILIITSDYHMCRAKYIASRYYSKAYGISSETPTTVRVNYAVREYVAVLKMMVLGAL